MSKSTAFTVTLVQHSNAQHSIQHNSSRHYWQSNNRNHISLNCRVIGR